LCHRILDFDKIPMSSVFLFSPVIHGRPGRLQDRSLRVAMTQYRIMIRCPATGKKLDSGIRTSGRETVSSGLFQDGGYVACRHCSQLHSMEQNSYLELERTASSAALWRPNR